MNRRTFIKSSGALGAASVLSIKLSSRIDLSNYKMGYQLYSIRDEMAKDPISTLKVLISMGYQDFEVYGYDDKDDSFYGIKSKEFSKVLSDLNITVTSGHYGFSPYLLQSDEEMKRFVDRCIKGAKAIDSKYITWPWIAPELRIFDNFKLMAHKLNVIGEHVKKAGLGFSYHNHGFEFENHNGQNGYDIILSETDASLVKLQMDMYWVMHSSKLTPKQLIESQPGRFVMWHIKDMDKISRDYTELGNGSIDYINLLPDPIKSGMEFYYLEQGGNFAVDSTTSAATSAKYFQNNLKHLI